MIFKKILIMMTRKIYITLLSLTVTMMVSAQSMTYNHDEVVMNQFMKAEIGSGTLDRYPRESCKP